MLKHRIRIKRSSVHRLNRRALNDSMCMNSQILGSNNVSCGWLLGSGLIYWIQSNESTSCCVINHRHLIIVIAWAVLYLSVILLFSYTLSSPSRSKDALYIKIQIFKLFIYEPSFCSGFWLVWLYKYMQCVSDRNTIIPSNAFTDVCEYI